MNIDSLDVTWTHLRGNLISFLISFAPSMNRKLFWELRLWLEQIFMGNRDKEHASLLYANGACIGFGIPTSGFEWSRLKSVLKTCTLLVLLYVHSDLVIHSCLTGFCFLSFYSAWNSPMRKWRELSWLWMNRKICLRICWSRYAPWQIWIVKRSKEMFCFLTWSRSFFKQRALAEPISYFFSKCKLHYRLQI